MTVLHVAELHMAVLHIVVLHMAALQGSVLHRTVYITWPYASFSISREYMKNEKKLH